MKLLACESVRKQFGGLTAVDDVDLQIEKGEIVGLIGPNGAGKTTLFNLITGYLRPTSGKVSYLGESISSMPPNIIAAKGLVRTFQKINVFGDLTVMENVLIGRSLHIKPSFLNGLIQSPWKRREEKRARGDVVEILENVGMAKWLDHTAKSLPLGLQRALGIAVALAAGPKLLLLDEPASGMTIDETAHLMELVRKIQRSGVTLLIVEHDMSVVMNLCKRIVVLDYGSVVAEGSPQEIQRDPKVIEVYLGKGFRDAAENC